MALTPLFTEGNFALRFSSVVGVWFLSQRKFVCLELLVKYAVDNCKVMLLS